MILAVLSLLKTPIVHKTAYQIVQGVSIASYSSFVCLLSILPVLFSWRGPLRL